mgnify:CR=1 FL=1
MDIKELGLPKKFSSWRDGQAETVETIRANLYDHKVVLYDGPCGVGKSIVALAVASCLGLETQVIKRITEGQFIKPRCVYVTRTKQLQKQILSEFPKARGIKGRVNYPCAKYPNKFPEISADDCHKETCSKQASCRYYLAKREAVAAPISVLNYSYFLTEANGVGTFSGADILILDEVDSLEGELMNHIQFAVSTKQLERFGLELPAEDSWNGWRSWAVQAFKKVGESLLSIERQLPLDEKEWGVTELKACKKLSALQRFAQKLTSFVYEAKPETWVYTMKEEADGTRSWMFKPIFVNTYSRLFLKHGEKVLGMSGTILDPETLAYNLGIEDWSYFKTESPFPAKNRPIHYVPAANLTKKSMQEELPKLVAAVERILQLYPNDKILVHTTSYPVRDYLQFRLDLSRVITHDANNRAEKLEEFKRSPEPLVMLSPSFDRGVDLRDDQCRVVIIAKIPWADLGDHQIKARMKALGGDKWYLLHTVQTIVQMSGRGVRAPNDYATTFICDKQFSKVYQRANHLFPEWWKAALTSDIQYTSPQD